MKVRADQPIQVEELRKEFGGVKAIQGLSLQIPRGEVTGLIGPNGAGKTTLFNLITGVLRPDSGTVTLDGRRLDRMRPSAIVSLGVARSFQDMRLFPRMTAVQNILVAQPWRGGYLKQMFQSGRAAGVDTSSALDVLDRLDLLGIRDELVSDLSFGQQKVLSLGRLLATDADFLLLDEPAAGLDRASIDSMVALLRELADEGLGICVIEHSMDVIGTLCDRVAFLAAGECLGVGSTNEIMKRDEFADLFFGAST